MYSKSRLVVTTRGLALIYKTEEAGDYYLFIYNMNGCGSTYRGTATIVPTTVSSNIESIFTSSNRSSSVSPAHRER